MYSDSMLQKLKWLLLMFTIPGILALSIFILERNDFFLIDDVNIVILTTENQKNYSKEYLEKVNEDLEQFIGESLIQISLGKISDALKGEKWIKEYRISREWPSTLEITIQPQRLAYLLTNPKQLSEGVFYPVTEDAEVLAPISSTQAPALAMLVGNVFRKDVEKRKKAVELLKSLPSEGRMSHDKVAEVEYNSEEGYWLKLVDSSMKIKLGEDDFTLKSNRVAQVLDYLEKKDLKARVIDANLSKKVLVRLQQNP